MEYAEEYKGIKIILNESWSYKAGLGTPRWDEDYKCLVFDEIILEKRGFSTKEEALDNAKKAIDGYLKDKKK